VKRAHEQALRALAIGGCALPCSSCDAESRAASASEKTVPAPISATPPSPAPSSTPAGSCNPAPADRGGTIIDDFDANDGRARRAENRVAYWWSLGDGSAGKLLPDPAEADDIDRQRENRSLHILARDFKKWGARIGISLFWSDGEMRCPLNASGYAGFRFRAKGSGSLAAQLVTRDTASPRGGGRCENRCFDHHQVIVQIQPDWTTHAFRWSDLRQQGWGEAATLRTERVVGITFAVQVADLPVNAWIDDLEWLAAEPAR
jgi:hypothetical protein